MAAISWTAAARGHDLRIADRLGPGEQDGPCFVDARRKQHRLEMRSQIGEKADMVGAGDRPVVPVRDPRIESHLRQSVAERAGAGVQLVVRDHRSRRDSRDPTRPWGYASRVKD
jgi:hypothetical protein